MKLRQAKKIRRWGYEVCGGILNMRGNRVHWYRDETYDTATRRVLKSLRRFNPERHDFALAV